LSRSVTFRRFLKKETFETLKKLTKTISLE
jgi:hypothetical protein